MFYTLSFFLDKSLCILYADYGECFEEKSYEQRCFTANQFSITIAVFYMYRAICQR